MKDEISLLKRLQQTLEIAIFLIVGFFAVIMILLSIGIFIVVGKVMYGGQ